MTFDTSHRHPKMGGANVNHMSNNTRGTLKLGLVISAKLAREFLCFINSEVVKPDGVLGFSVDNLP